MSSRARVRTRDRDGEFLWLVSLSDLMILLFVFFVVLYSARSPEIAALRERRSGETGAPALPAVAPYGPHPVSALAPLDPIQTRLLKWVVDRKLLGSVNVERKEDALILNIKEGVLFDSGTYALREGSRDLIAVLSSALERIPAPYRIGVEGHTDDEPFTGTVALDNWDLSAKRAHSVLSALRLPEETRRRSVILGYGAMKPVVPNRDESDRPIAENRARNRRVTIRIF